ncbi:MAG TPA: hypothetical protein VGA49_03640 [Patescibacteria group bacterium]
MNFKHQTQSDQLDRYSFLWSQARLILAAIALFLGGVPPILAFLPIAGLYGLLSSLLTLAWIISGLAAGYMIYRWNQNNQKIFGGKNQKDTIAFFISVVSGLNLGLAGLSGKNIGMSISSLSIVFILVGILYLATAIYLQQRWNASKQKLFG